MTQDAAQQDCRSTRREFLKTSGSAAAGALAAGWAIPQQAYAAGGEEIRVGLVGCGGRGTGAAGQALRTEGPVKLVAMGDAFRDHLESSLRALKSDQYGVAHRVAVDPDHQFVGFDAFQKVVDSVDVVLLAAPPHFRPRHLKAAIEAGRHVFAEKPVAVDAPGVRSVLQSCALAKQKGLSIVSGLCWRYDHRMRATFAEIHKGTVGDIVAMQCSYLTGGVKPHHERQPDWSDMEYQLRNWYYYEWLSGDHNVEQHIHSLDKMAWAMQDEYPVRCTAMGGRQARVEPKWGNIYDHFAAVYEYENGVKAFSYCRQQDGCKNDVSDHVMGSKGTCDVFKHRITGLAGESSWSYRGPKNNMYQTEHDELFASIRSGNPINNGDYMAKSTLMAIMARMAAYTGQTITWEQALGSSEDLTPPAYDWGPLPVAPVPTPGVTQFA